MKAAFVTLGCKVNQYETNSLIEELKKNGFALASSSEEADVYIVNSCTVTAESSRKSRQALRKLRNEHPNAITVLTGCYSQAYKNELEALSEADIILGNKTNSELISAIKAFNESKKRTVNVISHKKEDKYSSYGTASFEGHTRAFIKIQDGCNRYCTYCIIPVSRGFSRSRPLDEIADELKTIAENGYKEVVFVGINLSAYGLEIKKNICDALILAENTPGIERIRLGSLEPDHITDEVIENLKKMKKFCPQFHLSLQSGCDKTLKKMNRHYSRAEFEQLCIKLKEAFPDLSLTTDIIVGFPGETEDDFNDTAEFAEKIGFMKVHVFPFSSREGTPAANYENQISKKTKTERCSFLQKKCDEIRLGFLNNLIGTEQEVLFETPKNGLQRGYTKNYTPVAVRCENALNGQILKVKITGIENDMCCGILIN
ncbi:MAG: tRNA (N(6)-L-threonylcarbamoyladenosine(37)-C(2))-methylthiotransferase MtaB [Oscillospiraceae bacterium]|nr:tRNA (N(6)-L-threonylcarbamoyladenosine(37)-C(2))-methylthiotransferase MtaB [Oscillospiraceae bacterium]